MLILHVVLLLLSTRMCRGETLEPGSLVSNEKTPNETISGRQAGYGLIRFEGQVDHDGDQNGLVTFTEDSHRRPLKFEDEPTPSYTVQTSTPDVIGGADQNNISSQNGSSQNLNQNAGQPTRVTKRKRKRKPKEQFQLPYQPLLGPGGTQLPLPTKARIEMPPGPLRTITDALESILLHDTRHCVSRMLCEQAAGGQLSNSSMMRSILELMQYLPVFQKAVSFNAFPLFKSVGLLMMATRTGALSKDITACEERYSECPNDPEERIHYFNNHQGGLFRFFRGKDEHQYTAEEFHNHLVQMGLNPHNPGQYGLYQAKPNAGQYGVQQPASNGAYQANQHPGQYSSQQSYLYAGQYGVQQTYPSAGKYGVQQTYPSAGKYGVQQAYHSTGKYGVQRPNFQNMQTIPNGPPVVTKNGYSRPNTGYAHLSLPSYATYGTAYPYHRRFNSNGDRFRSDGVENEDSNIFNNEIQKRIQNKPEVFADDNFHDKDVSIQWSFPKFQSAKVNVYSSLNKIRSGKQLKFPEEETQREHSIMNEAKGFSFPGAQSDRQYLNISSDGFVSANFDSTFDTTGYANMNDELQEPSDDHGIELVYVVRGNGDPTRPEIIKLRPGEKVH